MRRPLVLALLLWPVLGAARAETVPIDIGDNAFDPDTVTVAVNDVVQWVNRGQHDHTVKFSDRDTSGPVPPGETHADSFEAPGTYAYRCEIHASMTGTVVVRASGTTTTSSTTTTTTTSTTTATDRTTTTSTTSMTVAEATTTTASTTVPASDSVATGVTDSDGDDDDNVDMPAGVAALLLLVTAGFALAQARGGLT